MNSKLTTLFWHMLVKFELIYSTWSQEIDRNSDKTLNSWLDCQVSGQSPHSQNSEANLVPCQISKMKPFVKIVNAFSEKLHFRYLTGFWIRHLQWQHTQKIKLLWFQNFKMSLKSIYWTKQLQQQKKIGPQ